MCISKQGLTFSNCVISRLGCRMLTFVLRSGPVIPVSKLEWINFADIILIFSTASYLVYLNLKEGVFFNLEMSEFVNCQKVYAGSRSFGSSAACSPVRTEIAERKTEKYLPMGLHKICPLKWNGNFVQSNCLIFIHIQF